MNFGAYNSYADYLGGKASDTLYTEDVSRTFYKASDMLVTLEIVSVSMVNSAPEDGDKRDFGFYFDDEPIEIGFIDPIPVEHLEDTTVTLAGDTIYDYTITNNTTGDTSTVNYFVTNNYTYENSGGNSGDSGSSDGGSTSGDVNVGGKVDVSGDIEVGGKVDVNINVSSGSGTGVEFDQDVSLENYYDWMNEETAGFSEFMAGFLSWLPSPIITLLCCGFGAVVLMRFIGR